MNENQLDLVAFQCNICDSFNESPRFKLTREEPSCSKCGSTVRMRSIIHVLTSEVFGQSMTISQIDPPRPDIVGIGMSCWHGYAGPLAHRIAFTNTYLHQDPKLDITKVDVSAPKLDFIVSSDVFEHVAAPVSRAFANAKALLKEDGVLIFTVPYFHPGEEKVLTSENFYNLHDFEIVEDPEHGPILRNTEPDGSIRYFYNLVFHGGEGSTLEMRRFSEWSVLQDLRQAGFSNLTIYNSDYEKFGIYWPLRHSAPIAARVR